MNSSTSLGMLSTPALPLTAASTAATGSKSDHRAPAGETTQAVEQLESMFLSMILKQMRQSVGGEGLFPSDSSDTLGGMFDMFLGDHLAASGGLGLSTLLAPQQGPESIPAIPNTHQRNLETYRDVAIHTQ